MTAKYKKVLIINTFGIGDVLFSTPMVKAIRESFPEAKIDFMCNRRCRHIIENNRDINEVIVFEKDEFRGEFKKSKIMFVKKTASFIRMLAAKKYDLLVDLSLGYQMSLLLMLLGVKKRLGLNYRNRGRFLTDKLNVDGFNEKHVVDYYMDILKLIGIEDFCSRQLELELPGEAKMWADSFASKKNNEKKKLICVAPGGGKSWGEYAVYRRWDPENFSYVAGQLIKKNSEIFILILGSIEEKPLCNLIKDRLGANAIDLCGELSLSRSIALIRKCRLLLCNDGGILHTAVSQGIDTISIFGPVNDAVYGPYPNSDKHTVIKAKGVNCRPCYKNFKPKICDTRHCLKQIDRDEVVKFADDVVNRKYE